MPGIRQLLGGRGERAAARFLRRRGYAILARNYRCRRGEVDLIAMHGGTVVFVEVKTRTSGEHGDAVEAVGPAKQRRVARAAAHFLAVHDLHDLPIRFDVIGVTPRGLWAACRHIVDAFEAPE